MKKMKNKIINFCNMFKHRKTASKGINIFYRVKETEFLKKNLTDTEKEIYFIINDFSIERSKSVGWICWKIANWNNYYKKQLLENYKKYIPKSKGSNIKIENFL